MRIGVVDQGNPAKLRLYTDAVAAAGAAFTVIGWDGDPERDAAAFDGLVLCGGDDVDARRWGEPNHATVTLCPPERDEYEIRFARRARDLGVPLLGVCRGHQVLNVACGGSLVQHVPELPGAGVHGGGARHAIRIEAGTRLHALAGRADASVNSFHHQAVGRLGVGLRVSSRSPDGVVEAIEPADPAAPFLVGVQWHPEREGNDPPLGAGLFAALVAAARR